MDAYLLHQSTSPAEDIAVPESQASD
jgi:hypothetical protein